MDFTIRDTLNRSIGPSGGVLRHQRLRLRPARDQRVGCARSTSASRRRRDVGGRIEFRREAYEHPRRRAELFRHGSVLLNGDPTPSRQLQVFPGFHSGRRSRCLWDRHGRGAPTSTSKPNLTEQFLAFRRRFGRGLLGLRRRGLRQALAARYDFTSSSPSAGRCRTASGRPRSSSSSSQPPRPTSSTACRSTSTFPTTDPVAVALGAKPLDPRGVGELRARRSDAVPAQVGAHRRRLPHRRR